MKRCLGFALVGICLAMLSALVGGCITVVIPQSSNSQSTTPADLVPAPNEPAHGGSKPIISSFTANPPGITQGASATLSWNISGASTVNIDKGIGNVGLNGTIIVSPSATTTYTLTAVNDAGITQTVTQVVVSMPSYTPPAALPVINSFVANPGSIATGDSSTLSWNVANAYTVTISPAIGTVAAAGSMIVIPSSTTSFILTATNDAGSSSVLATIVVNVEPSNTPNLVWTGTWNTDFNTMYLTQTDSQVTGEYEHDGGRIVGNVSGYVLKGTWSEAPTYSPTSSDAGDVELTMSPDGNSFTGHWRFGSSGDWAGNWSGTRITP